MASLQSYSLIFNGTSCDVSIEWGEAASSHAPAALPAQTVRTAPQVPKASSAAFCVPQPVQASWVTARRVAHLPFH